MNPIAKLFPREGCVSLSWDTESHWYVTHNRISLGRVALTFLPVSVDDLMEAYVWFGQHDAAMRLPDLGDPVVRAREQYNREHREKTENW